MTLSAAVLAVDPNKVQAGGLALLIVVILGVATWLLIRSMNRQMRKIREDLPRERHHKAPYIPPAERSTGNGQQVPHHRTPDDGGGS